MDCEKRYIHVNEKIVIVVNGQLYINNIPYVPFEYIIVFPSSLKLNKHVLQYTG